MLLYSILCAYLRIIRSYYCNFIFKNKYKKTHNKNSPKGTLCSDIADLMTRLSDLEANKQDRWNVCFMLQFPAYKIYM